MALIDCPECGEKITATAEVCVHCGYMLKYPRKKRKHNRLLIGMVCVVLILGVVFSAMLYNFISPAQRAIRMIKNDCGRNINVYTVHYNEEQNGCYVEFSIDGVEDSACVHFDTNTVGYESVWDRMSAKVDDPYITDEQRHEYAKEAVAYLDYYYAGWSYNVFMHGGVDGEWKLVYLSGKDK